jgi:hypothetical protein
MRKFHPYAVAAEAKGRKIYHLNIGQPDIETPKAYFDAVKHFDLPVLAYAPSPGIPELIEAILDAEFPEDGAAALDDEDEPEDEPEDEEAEEEEAEDEEEEEEEEEEEDDGQAERAEELSGFNRVALKKVLAEVDPSFRVLKKHSDDDLRDAILAAEFGEDETPF